MEYVGTEYVLMVILDHGLGVGVQVMENYSVSLAAVKGQINSIQKQTMHETWVLGRLPGTPHFKQVIACAIEEAEKVKDKKVGTEYFLLGILRETGCVAQRALAAQGMTLTLARAEVARLQGRPGLPEQV